MARIQKMQGKLPCFPGYMHRILIESSSTQRVAELDRRIRELNEERAEMYKTQSENAQRLVNLNEQLRTREEKDLKQTEE